MREELIQSAIKFLLDSKISKSPLSKKVAFLESKGLTVQEIETALSKVNKSNLSPQLGNNGHIQQQSFNYSQYQPYMNNNQIYHNKNSGTSWKGYIAAIALTGSLGYVLYNQFKKYLKLFPSEEELRIEKANIDRKFDMAFQHLQDLQQNSDNMLKSVYSNSNLVNKSLEKLSNTIEDFNLKDNNNENESIKLTQEIEELKKLIEENNNKNKENQASLFEDLSMEIKAIKDLIWKNSLNKLQGKIHINDGAEINKLNNINTDGFIQKIPNTPNFIPKWQLEQTKDNKLKENGKKLNGVIENEVNKVEEVTESSNTIDLPQN